MVLSKRKPRRVRRKLLKMRRGPMARRKRSVRKFQNKLVKQMAPAPFKPDLKSYEVRTTPVRQGSRNLYFVELTQVPRYNIGTGRIPPNQRQGASIQMKGMRIQFTVHNTLAADFGVFNWAIIQPIGGKQVSPDGFFRTNNASRDVNFSQDLSSHVIQYSDLNTDKMLVLRHKRFFLSPLSVDGFGGATCRRHVQEWIPFKGMIRFNDDVEDEAENPIFFIHWFDYDATVAGSPPVVDAIEYEAIHVMYFNDTL